MEELSRSPSWVSFPKGRPGTFAVIGKILWKHFQSFSLTQHGLGAHDLSLCPHQALQWSHHSVEMNSCPCCPCHTGTQVCTPCLWSSSNTGDGQKKEKIQGWDVGTVLPCSLRIATAECRGRSTAPVVQKNKQDFSKARSWTKPL